MDDKKVVSFFIGVWTALHKRLGQKFENELRVQAAIDRHVRALMNARDTDEVIRTAISFLIADSGFHDAQGVIPTLNVDWPKARDLALLAKASTPEEE